MNCISPPELEDSQLLAYLDGETDQQTKSHLEHCEYCREKAKALGRLQDHLSSRLYRITCPSSLELGEYHLHMLESSQMLLVAQHLRECPHCTREITQLKEFLSDLKLTSEENLLGKVKVLIAHLIAGQLGESSSTPDFAALRGEAKGPLVFEADGIVITLDVQSSLNGKISMLGQVATDDQDDWTGAIVKLLQIDMPELTSVLDGLGAFAFEGIRLGSTQLKIISPNGVEVQIPNTDITV